MQWHQIATKKASEYLRVPVPKTVKNQNSTYNNWSKQDGEYNWIGHVIDCFTKFHILFPLKSKEAGKIADNMATRVFSHFGMPYLLQSDNGREFVNSVMTDLLQSWEGLCKTINGRPRHPHSQGTVERGNQGVENMIRVLQKTQKSNKWSIINY